MDQVGNDTCHERDLGVRTKGLLGTIKILIRMVRLHGKFTKEGGGGDHEEAWNFGQGLDKPLFSTTVFQM